TTKYFCGDKKVTAKTCYKDRGNARVTGYFKGWASNWPCNVFHPEQMPLPLYTHINFAFATTDPKTFNVLLAVESYIGLYKRLVVLKKKDLNLKIFIAIGGWALNDPGPTATTFSDILIL
ncbi:glycoside hydrolase superfamily, partial [Colletotrichum navitas]